MIDSTRRFACTLAVGTLVSCIPLAATVAGVTKLPTPLISPVVQPPAARSRLAPVVGPSFEEEVVELTNQERWNNGQLPPLKHEALLDTSSETHSGNMADRDFFAHCDPDTLTGPSDRMSHAGYVWNWAGENIAVGYSSAASVVVGWMNSPGHRANILRTDFHELGVGYVYQNGDVNNIGKDDNGDCTIDNENNGPFRHYWTQNFGTRNDVAPVVINREAFETQIRQVELYLYGADWATQMRLRNESGTWTAWQPFAESVSWELSIGNGSKDVFVELKNNSGTLASASDTILLNGVEEPPLDTDGDGDPDATDPDDDNDGIADWVDPDPLDETVALAPVWLADTVARANHNWAFVDAASGYLDAVVIAGPPTYHGPDPGVVRLQGASDLGFDLRFQEWDYRARDFADSYHAVEDIPYVVLQPGRHLMSDGSVWEVGTFDLSDTSAWQGLSFTEPFANPPSLFLTVQTSNDPAAITVRARNLTVDGFEAALFEEEALNDGHLVETIGYLAIDSPGGGGLVDLDGESVPYLLQSLSADERWSPVLSQRLMVEEEQSRDSEVGHIDETLQVLALGNQVFAQQVSHNGADTTALRRLEPTTDAPMEWGLLRGVDHDWQTLPFAKTYTDPVLIAKPASSIGSDPGVIRQQGMTGTHAQLRYQEWNYLDGNHGSPEDVFYLISEAGAHSLGGLSVEADWLVSNKLGRAGQWTGIGFSAPFATVPVVQAAVMSYQGADAVTTRIRNIDFDGFDLAMDEQEAKSDGHVNENLGWIAIEQGTATTADGRTIQVFFDELDHNLSTVVYPSLSQHRHPTVMGDVDSTFGSDPVFLRYANPTNAQIELKLTEEQSKDTETTHVPEDVGVFVGE